MEKIYELLGRVIVLKNEDVFELFQIIGSDENDFVLKKIEPIFIENENGFRNLLREA